MTMMTSDGMDAPIVTHGPNRRSASRERPSNVPIASAAARAIRNAPTMRKAVMPMSDQR